MKSLVDSWPFIGPKWPSCSIIITVITSVSTFTIFSSLPPALHLQVQIHTPKGYGLILVLLLTWSECHWLHRVFSHRESGYLLSSFILWPHNYGGNVQLLGLSSFIWKEATITSAFYVTVRIRSNIGMLTHRKHWE